MSVLTMKANEVFYFLTPEEFAQFLPYLTETTIESGRNFLVEGQQDNFMGFLLEGRLAVKKPTEFSGKFQAIALLDPGAPVGEAGILENNSAHGATISAIVDSRLALLSRKSFHQLLQDNPKLAATILSHLLHIINLRLQKTSHRLSRVL